MRKFVKRIAFIMLICLAFVLGYFTHRNELIPLKIRNMIRVLLREKMQAPKGDSQTDPDNSKVRNLLNVTLLDSQANHQVGEWYPFVAPRTDTVPDEFAESKEALESIAYLSAYNEAPNTSDVVIYDKDRAYNGLNLYTSGHAQEAVLIDMTGKILHKWNHDYWKVWPDYKPPEYIRSTGHQNWRRVYLYENGDLIALHDGIGIIKLDKDSNLLWSFRGGCHHDLFIAENGDIYVLTREAKIIPRIHPDKLVLEPTLTVLDHNGKPKQTISILECFEKSRYAPLLNSIPEYGDIFHINTIELLDGRIAEQIPAFKKGTLLISIWTMNAIAVVDPNALDITWAMSGMWLRQHQPTVLDNGNLLIFDNRGHKGESQIIEFDPSTREEAWSYRGDEDNKFFTSFCGSSERLPNGNTLITETNNGRAFEVTRDKEIVWEYINPNRIEENNMTLIASLFEVLRYGPDYNFNWLSSE